MVVLISGGGSNLRALLEAVAATDFPARVVAVGADRVADGFAHAREFGLPTFTTSLSDYPDRESWGEAIIGEIDRWAPDLVVLSGFMRLLPHRVVEVFSPNLINTHPSYLPEFPGAHAVRDALAAGATQTGGSIIVVDGGLDTGAIIAQRRVPVHPDDTEPVLHERIKVVERELLVQTVLGIATGTINLKELVTA